MSKINGTSDVRFVWDLENPVMQAKLAELKLEIVQNPPTLREALLNDRTRGAQMATIMGLANMRAPNGDPLTDEQIQDGYRKGIAFGRELDRFERKVYWDNLKNRLGLGACR